MTTNSGLQTLQREAWAFGRSLRDSLLADFERDYGEPAPPPALIGGELLTDFMGARLSYDALPLNVFAETTWQDGQPLVTVNSRTREIEGVKDPEGVSNVGIWHEAIHVHRDLSSVRVGPQAAFDGMLPNLTIACHRQRQYTTLRGEDFQREYFAEEAGRAAAVSFPHLVRVREFRDFIYLGERGLLSSSLAWRKLYTAAETIGVNISALIKQMEAEGLLHVERSRGRSVLYPQPGLGNLLVRPGY
ncbi:MAG: hypothetical protein O2843_06525 [Chloroflexi bacterium]|nr:hypothetical protein [Chloroflexota bacterium]